MNIYFEQFFIQENAPVFWGFVVLIAGIIVYTIYAVRKETKK